LVPDSRQAALSDANIVHTDHLRGRRAGKTIHDSVQGLTWEAGVGMKLYLRARHRPLTSVTSCCAGGAGARRITNNVTVLAGVSLWLPG